MSQLLGSAPSLRVFEHVDEIYKENLLDEECPRLGDFAEIRRSHCTSESGMLVRVIDYPHWCLLLCGDCGQHMTEYQVRVEPLSEDIRLKWEAIAPGGPWLYPLAWLKRWRADQVSNTAVAGAK